MLALLKFPFILCTYNGYQAKVEEEPSELKCFCKAGVLDSDMAVVERDGEDPFAEADEFLESH